MDRPSACAGEERPSLFSDSGNRLPHFNPFATAFASLGPAERYEAEFMGASEFLNRRLNEEFQRAFEAGIPSSAIYPSPEIYHIGTPSAKTQNPKQVSLNPKAQLPQITSPANLLLDTRTRTNQEGWQSFSL